MNRGFAETKEEGEALINNFLSQYPNVDKFLKRQAAAAVTTGYTQDLFGRIRWYQLPDTADESVLRTAAASASRQGQNFPIQALSASITKQAIIDVYEYLKEHQTGNIMLTIHDSIICELDEETAGMTIRDILQIMEAAGTKIVPTIVTPVDAEVGRKEVRYCELTKLPFKVFSHEYKDGAVRITPDRYEPRVAKIVRDSPEDERFETLKRFTISQDQDWRKRNMDIVVAVQEIAVAPLAS